ncbi:hypothetical protein K488DRAFT_41979 [Vararia minispora EC-137]|uniref:Uncharacterized protein n=1 Tax=Vararia minispora EC-137 TaxID=1314806 RepID=A0ACB8QVW1_9AGAM|nr:hypothetical protein K488DRAFT_41979 [Vararia minispora EC-137]
MEKFSAYRDPGTGIQPFLTPVPAVTVNSVFIALVPLRYVFGAIRMACALLLAVLHLLFVEGVCRVLMPIKPLHHAVSCIFTAITCRLALLFLGLAWIPTEQFTRKRGQVLRLAQSNEPFRPGPGDLIVSNWISWIEILYLAFRFNPVFVLPVVSTVEKTFTSSSSSVQTPGRRTGTGSAAISGPSIRSTVERIPVIGFQRVSLFSMVTFTGNVPSGGETGSIKTLEEICRYARSPVAVFPECTTSNGRGLLRFAEIFKGWAVPTKGHKVFVACFRCDPPNAFMPTLSHSIPTSANPLSHAFSLASSFVPLSLSVRFLAPSDSPSSGSFMPSEIVGIDVGGDTLAASCAGLISQLGKLRKVQFGWEEKAAFLALYHSKRR